MNRIARRMSLALLAMAGGTALAQAPQGYTLKAEGAFPGGKRTVTIVRDGPRERVETAFEVAGRGRIAQASLYDFEAHRVHWIGWSGAGSCSSGRYLSARAPVEEDPVTGTPEALAALAAGRSRKAAGAGKVAGLPARVEALVGGKRPTKAEDFPWPNRVWLAEEGGWLLKVEGESKDGKPVTILEVTELTIGRPAGAQLGAPADCVATDSEMDDAGSIRAHGASSANVQASATTDLGAGKTSATVTATSGATSAPRPGPLAKLGAVTLSVVPEADGGPCGRRLQVTATFEADGPATIWFKVQPSVGGVQFPEGQVGTVTLDGAGSAAVTKNVTFQRTTAGQLRLQAQVKGTKGHDGQMKTSEPAAFDVACGGR